MDKKQLEKLVNRGLEKGADFCDIFIEKKTIKKYWLADSKIDRIITNLSNGAGIRIAKGNTILYSSTNHPEEENLLEKIDQLNAQLKGKPKETAVKLNEEKAKTKPLNILHHNDFDNQKKKEYLFKIDQLARNYSSQVIQVEAMFYEMDQKVTIANSLGKLINDTRILTRLYISITVKGKEKTAESYRTFGISGGYELLEGIAIEEVVKDLVERACKKLNAIPCPGGEMPVILGPGFGAVILHEACGHALEATSVAKNLSILSGKKGQKIAHSKVTLIDDGSIPKEWGSLTFDDEGNTTQKNILIQNGILTNYLVDYLNSKKMNSKITGSGRRESYQYPPTSRMNNTYLQAGTDSFTDMLKSMDYGLYAKQMNGGSVNPITGDFNFSVTEGYLIRNGQICELVTGASLIGNTLDILNKIEMVSDDFCLETGICSSESGSVAVTVGQPTIKVSKILVGGEKNDR